MKKSLRDKLTDMIRERGEVSYGEIMQYTAELGYRPPTAERRLRSSESPDIEAVMGRSARHTGFIRAYRWKGAPKPTIEWRKEGDTMVQIIKN